MALLADLIGTVASKVLVANMFLAIILYYLYTNKCTNSNKWPTCSIP